MKTVRKKVRLARIHDHPGRDRSPLVADDEFVQLTVQILEADGINDHQNILVCPHEEDGNFYNLSGLRRYHALVLGLELRAMATDDEAFAVGEDGFSFGYVHQHLPAVVERYGDDVESAVKHLVSNGYADHELTVAYVKVTDPLEQGLMLGAENNGQQSPDLLGRANSYRWLAEQGATCKQIAQRFGQPLATVRTLLALGNTSEQLQQLILDKTYPLGVCQTLGTLSADQAQGVEWMLLEMVKRPVFQRPTGHSVQEMAKHLKQFTPQLPMQFASQPERNLARLWASVMADRDAATVAYAFAMVFQLSRADVSVVNQPWLDEDDVGLWLEHLLGNALPEIDGYTDWHAVAHKWLPTLGLGCATCPLNKLPTRILENDLARTSADSVFGLPCRSPLAEHREQYAVCFNAFGKDEPLRVELPEAFRGHPDVQDERGVLFVDSAETLRVAWNYQFVLEKLTDAVTFNGQFIFRERFDKLDAPDWRCYILSDSDGARGFIAEHLREDGTVDGRTAIKVTFADLLDAVAHDDIKVTSGNDAGLPPIYQHRRIHIASFTSGGFEEEERHDYLLSSIEGTDGIVEQFRLMVGDGWELCHAIHPEGQYFYGRDPELGTLTRGHESVMGVVYDIDPSQLDEAALAAAEERYADDEGAGQYLAEALDDYDEVVNSTETDATVVAATSNDKQHHQRIRAFVENERAQTVVHPFATPCATCRFQLGGSPVASNPDAPHCAWAKGRRKLAFRLIRPLATELDKQFPPFEQCGQFKPKATWHEIIPAHSKKPPLPRSWYLEQIRALVRRAVSRTQDSYGDIGLYPFHFLTGRPMKASESWSTWFKQELDEQQGNLSDKQVFTLFIWVVAEWQRLCGSVHEGGIPLPVDAKAQQFIAVKNVAV